MLLIGNCVWLLLEYAYFNTHHTIIFPLARLFYFTVVGIVRAEGRFDRDPLSGFEEADQRRTREYWRAFYVFCTDVASWFFLIWTFGRSIM